MSLGPVHLLLGALALGLLGAMVGAWGLSRGIRRQLAAQLQAQLDTQMQVLRDATSLRQEPVKSVEVALPNALVHSVEAMQAAQAAISSVSSEFRAALVEFTGKARALSERDGILRNEMQALQQVQDGAADRIQDVLNAQAEQQRQQLQLQAQQFQSVLEEWRRDLREIMSSNVPAQPERPPPAALPQGVDAGPLIEQLQVRIAADFEAQRQAVGQAQQQAGQALQQALQRVPQLVQQAIQVELEFQAQQQAARDEARADEQQRWQAEQKEHRAVELRLLFQALASQPGKPALAIAAESAQLKPSPLAPPPSRSAISTPTVSARPPELMHTPLPRPEPTYEREEPAPELSDEELDALPPELPDSGKLRKRILPAPKKPSLRNL